MFRNVLEATQNLVQQYVQKFKEDLQNNSLGEDEITHISRAMQRDSGLYLARNPNYAKSQQPFADFVTHYQMPLQMVECFPKLTQHALYAHQVAGIESILSGHHTIIATGTGSGKTETFLIPILSHCLQNRQRGVKAIIVYPMNALASDQIERLTAYTQNTPITFGLYNGDTDKNTSTNKTHPNRLLTRRAIQDNPPDILITNYVMLDRLLTRAEDITIFNQSRDTLRYIVLDELHSYNGSKATHIHHLLARLVDYFNHPPVFIGTSATLTNDDAGLARLDTFLNNLFGIKKNSYTLIQAIEEVDDFNQSANFPTPTLNDSLLADVDFTNDTRAAQSLSLLTGVRVAPTDFYVQEEQIHTSEFYQALSANPYVIAIRDALKQSAQRLSDLIAHLDDTRARLQLPPVDSERLLTCYLDAIVYVNEKVGGKGKRLLDFRPHIFIADLSGYLKQCPTCQRYFIGGFSTCPHDQSCLFDVYRGNVRHAIAQINQGEHCLYTASDTPKQTKAQYVVIARADTLEVDDSMMRVTITPNGHFKNDEHGQHVLMHLDADAKTLEQHLIYLGKQHPDTYRVHLIKSLLRLSDKTLGFVDSREEATRTSAVARDEFASAFLEAFLRLYYPRGNQRNIPKTLQQLKQRSQAHQNSDLEKAVFDELPLWFYRFINVPERLDGSKGLLKLIDNTLDKGVLTPLQHELIEIFLRERALDTRYTDDSSNSHYIRFQKHWATHPYGVYINDTQDDGVEYRGVSLNAHGQTHRDFVERWTQEKIYEAAEELVGLELLVSRSTPQGKTIYSLRSDHVCFNLPPSPYGEGEDNYERLRKDLLFRAETHSSDIKAEERETIENAFKNGEIHFIAATPTLEMGIDIGDLKTVLMLSAPPTPANYVQRAGRAGRGKERDALIVTFCTLTKQHDAYFFQNPSEMINGHITPPSFNPQNAEILQKHLNAFVLRGLNKQAFSRFTRDDYTAQIPHMRAIFGNWFDYAGYTDLFENILTQIRQYGNSAQYGWIEYCYQQSIFPDYNFRDDQVFVGDSQQRNVLALKRYSLNAVTEGILTNRDFEQALTVLTPHQTIYAAGDVYTILDEGLYTELADGSRQYQCLYAQKNEYFAKGNTAHDAPETSKSFSPLPHFRTFGDIVDVGYLPHGTLSLRQKQNQEKENTNRYHPIGYDLVRETLVLHFDSIISADEKNSFIAALIRTINTRYSLSNGEIRFMLDLSNGEASSNQSDSSYVVFYDNDGNNNLPMESIYDDFESLIEGAYEQLNKCPCENGCYDCIRSYNTQYLNKTIQKAHALNLIGYFVGQQRYRPPLKSFVSQNPRADLILTVEDKRSEFRIKSSTGQTYTHPQNGAYNAELFSSLKHAIEREYQPNMRVLKIETSMDWLVTSINSGSVNKALNEFNRLKFAFLKFDRVIVKKTQHI